LATFAVIQEAAESHPALRSHRIAIGLYDRTDLGLVRRAIVEIDVSGASTDVPTLIGQERPDLVLVNDDDLTYAKVRLDEYSLATLIEASIGSFSSSLPAAVCWAAAWDMCRDGEMAARDYVRLVLDGVSSVRDMSVVQTLLRQAAQAVRRFADPAWRDAGLELMASSLRSLMLAAPAGSDHQLAYTRAFAGVATSPADLELLSGLLSGSTVVAGLAVDTDLRWILLRRLVSRGAYGEAEIDLELTRDATDAGERHAATCRAAVPSQLVKRETWETLTDGKLTIAMFRATLTGFVDPDQRSLVEPYRPAYFAVVGDVWREWSSAMAQDFVAGGYQMCAVNAETVAVTDEYLATHDTPAALRRLLIEGRDEVLRSLRCQERDRAASLRQHLAPEVAQPDGQEQRPEAGDHRVHDVQVHVRRVGERRPHALVHVEQRVDQHQRLQPVEAADRDRGELGPRVVGAAEERDRQDDEAEHQADVPRLEAGPEH
jgi:aminopeptidase N